MSARSHAAAAPATPPRLRMDLLRHLAQRDLGPVRVIVAIAVIWAIFQSLESRFLTATNLTNLVLQITAVGLISVGVVLVLLLGEIDLSVGAVSGLCSAVMAILSVQHGWSPYLAVAAGVLAGTAIGLFHGLVFDRFEIPSFVVTLAGLLAWQGVQLKVLGTTGTVNLTDPTITGLAGTFYGGAVGWTIAVLGIVAFAGTCLWRRHERVRAGLSAPSPAAVALRIVAVSAV
jgi:D-xylose transport system permease protein